MRILHVADRLSDRGGAHTWLLGVVAGLAAGHEQRLVVGSRDLAAAPPCPTDVRPGLESLTATPVEIDEVVTAFAPEVVHVHNVANPAVLEWAARRGRAVLTVQDHRFFCPTRGKWTLAGEPCRRPLTRELCASCFEDRGHFARVHAVTEQRLAAARRLPLTVLSRYMREELVAAGIAPARVHVVPPFVHGLGEHEPAAAAEDSPCVLFVGRLVEPKGVRDAVAAWRLSGVPFPLVFAGTGPLRAELEALARSPRGRGIEVLGWVDRSTLAALYRRARALLLPSRWQEPFGIVGIEALSFGVPVAAWESGGIEEWHPGPGLVPWGDVPALAQALREAVVRRVSMPPRFERDEALGRLLALYARVKG